MTAFILYQALILLLFVAAFLVELKMEGIVYRQKDNKAWYGKLESNRKPLRNLTLVIFFCIGKVPIGFIKEIPILILGAVVFWVLFDGFYEREIGIRKSFWYLGKNNLLDRLLKTEKMSKIFKLAAISISLAGVIVENILLK